MNRVVWGIIVLAGCQAEGEGTPAAEDTGTELPVGCRGEGEPEAFLGRGVGGAFEPLAEGASIGLSVAPQGGFGVSVLIGTRGLQAGPSEIVSAELTAVSEAVEGSEATFVLEAALQCQTEGDHGVVYGVVVGFSSSLSNDDLLAMNGADAYLTVSVADALGRSAEVTQTVTLVVGE